MCNVNTRQYYIINVNLTVVYGNSDLIHFTTGLLFTGSFNRIFKKFS